MHERRQVPPFFSVHAWVETGQGYSGPSGQMYPLITYPISHAPLMNAARGEASFDVRPS